MNDLTSSQTMRLALIAIGHPVIYMMYQMYFWTFKHFYSFQLYYKFDYNSYKINLPLFLTYAFITYTLWSYVQVSIFSWLRKNKGFDKHKFFKTKTSKESLVVGILGGLHLLTWINGHESNVYGFIFFLPFCVLLIFSMMAYIHQTIGVFKGQYNISE